MSKRSIGRPKTRWEDYGLEDIESMNVRNWKKVAQNRDSWKKVVEQASLIQVVAFCNKKKKVHPLVQALRLCTSRTAHRGSRGIALLFLDHGNRSG